MGHRTFQCPHINQKIQGGQGSQIASYHTKRTNLSPTTHMAQVWLYLTLFWMGKNGEGKKPPNLALPFGVWQQWNLVGIEYRPRTFQNNKKIGDIITLSEYDVIYNFRPLISSKMRFSVTFYFSTELRFDTGIQNSILILIFGSKSGSGDDFGQYDTKTIILRRFFAKRL